VLLREENFTFKRTKGQGRRINAQGAKFEVFDDKQSQLRLGDLTASSAILSTLPRLGRAGGGEQVGAVADLLTGFRVFDVDVRAARAPAPLPEGRASPPLAADASNLAAFLSGLKRTHEEVFALLEDDLRAMLPGLVRLHFTEVGGSAEAVAVALEERGLQGLTPLAAASFGTVRALALLAMLHDPSPPKLSCVEEVDHGIHPYALDRIVERLRSATQRTQLLIATHSPALVNRLDPAELIVCERDPDTGATRMPAADPVMMRKMADESALSLGELWFSGALGGVP
jgi:predicted ATPase